MGLFDLPLHPSELMKTKLSPSGTWSHALDPQKDPIQDNDVVLARLRSVSCSFCVLFLPGGPYALEKAPSDLCRVVEREESSHRERIAGAEIWFFKLSWAKLYANLILPY